MATKNPRGLGRGLDALLGPALGIDTVGTTLVGTPRMLPLEALKAGAYQPRAHMDEGALYELAESIKAQGVMQPILVRPLGQKRGGADYEIIAGERRYRAARLAGLSEIPALVREVSDEAAAAMALIENMQREDLNPLEEAQGLRRLIQDFGLTHEQAAQAVGKSRSAASNLLRLLNLAEPVQTMLMAGDLEMGHARALLSLDGAAQVTVANQVVARKISVREAEALVRRMNVGDARRTPKLKKPADKSGDVRDVEEELSDLLLAQVEVRVKKRIKRAGKIEQSGELAIQFASLDELNGLIEKLRQI